MILVFLTGGASQLDLFDMKPDAPAEIRGDFRPIATKVPGVPICEHLPRLAARFDQWALIRTLSHGDNSHLPATHHTLTGRPMPLRRGSDQDNVLSRRDAPCYAAGLDYLRPRGDGIPSGVTLPNHLIEGPLTWPGQHAGFLGPRFDPWHIAQDPNSRPSASTACGCPPASASAGCTIAARSWRRSTARDSRRARWPVPASSPVSRSKRSRS